MSAIKGPYVRIRPRPFEDEEDGMHLGIADIYHVQTDREPYATLVVGYELGEGGKFELGIKIVPAEDETAAIGFDVTQGVGANGSVAAALVALVSRIGTVSHGDFGGDLGDAGTAFILNMGD